MPRPGWLTSPSTTSTRSATKSANRSPSCSCRWIENRRFLENFLEAPLRGRRALPADQQINLADLRDFVQELRQPNFADKAGDSNQQNVLSRERVADRKRLGLAAFGRKRPGRGDLRLRGARRAGSPSQAVPGGQRAPGCAAAGLRARCRPRRAQTPRPRGSGAELRGPAGGPWRSHREIRAGWKPAAQRRGTAPADASRDRGPGSRAPHYPRPCVATHSRRRATPSGLSCFFRTYSKYSSPSRSRRSRVTPARRVCSTRVAKTRWLAYRAGPHQRQQQHPSPARPAPGKGMGVPREIANRPDRAEVRQTALDAPESQRVQIRRCGELTRLLPRSVVAVVGTVLGGLITQW